jgi:hypothetical protein
MPPPRQDDFSETLLGRIRERARAKGRSLQEEIEDLLAFHAEQENERGKTED